MAVEKVTRAELAKRIGCSRQMIDRRVNEGVIKVDRNGRINAAAAERALARLKITGGTGPLATARLRKLKAQLTTAEDEVDALRRRALPPAEPIEAHRQVAELCRQRFAVLVADVAPQVAGLAAAAAQHLLTEAVRGALTELADTKVDAEPSAGAADYERARKVPTTATAIAARRVERLELLRQLRRGELVDLEHQVSPAVFDRVLNARSRLLALPTKVADQCKVWDAAKARLSIGEQVDEALAELDASPLAEDFKPWRASMSDQR